MQEEKYVKFNKWCDEIGIKRDSVLYPTAFGPSGTLVGISAKRRIGFKEAYIFVPTKVCLSEEQFRRSEIGHLLVDHPEVFEQRVSSAHMKLIFFVMYEMAKGTESFWHPYFQITEQTDMPCLWDVADLQNLQDENLK